MSSRSVRSDSEALRPGTKLSSESTDCEGKDGIGGLPAPALTPRTPELSSPCAFGDWPQGKQEQGCVEDYVAPGSALPDRPPSPPAPRAALGPSQPQTRRRPGRGSGRGSGSGSGGSNSSRLRQVVLDPGSSSD